MPDKRLVIIDGFSLLFRAFFGTRFMSTSDGKPTNALFGFTSMLFTLLEQVKPDAIVVAMDAPGKTFRHAEYEEYKGTRKETAPEFIEQIPHAYALIDALGIPMIEVTGFEADDVVGTLSLLAENNGYLTTIVSGDLDQLQLVDPCVTVMTSRTGVTDVVNYTPEAVIERYGVPPTAIPDWKAIVGDTSDNIPGVPGIGAKGATDLLQKHGSVEAILADLSLVEEKYAKKIEPAKDQLVKSKWLTTIRRDVPLEYDFEPFRVSVDQLEKARALMESFEFRSHTKKLPIVLGPYTEGGKVLALDESNSQAEVKLETKIIDLGSSAELIGWVADRRYALIFESVAAQSSMFDEPERMGYVGIGNEVARVSEEVAYQLFKAKAAAAIVHDAKPLYKKLGIKESVACDTLLAGYVLQSGRSSYALRDLIQGYLDIAPPTNMADVASLLHQLGTVMLERVIKEEQTYVLAEIEQPLTPVLARMEQHGIRVSSDVLHDFSKQLLVEIDKTADLIYEIAGEKVNIGSPKQLGELLFDKLQLPGPKKTKTGYATGAEVLQVLAPNYPICAEILTWRELTKLKSTYADSLPRMIADDGRIHTTFNQAVAATGRLSSIDPNLQNIPIRTELGRNIRRAFIAEKGYELLSCDYSQIELRVLAHMCGEEALVTAFAKREDVHAATASLMFNEPLEAVSKEHRRYAKLLNFAVLYGVTDFGLANQLGGEFSTSEAKALIQQYNERFPRVRDFMDSIIAEARAKGFTKTLCGRRRYFPDIHAQNRNERLYAERQAMNAPLQGTAADMIKLAMLKVDQLLEDSPVRMLLQVHDELVFEIPVGDRTMVESIRETMEQALTLNVPVEVEAKVGANWLEMTEVARA